MSNPILYMYRLYIYLDYTGCISNPIQYTDVTEFNPTCKQIILDVGLKLLSIQILLYIGCWPDLIWTSGLPPCLDSYDFCVYQKFPIFLFVSHP